VNEFNYVYEHPIGASDFIKCKQVLKQLQYMRNNNLYYKIGNENAEITAIEDTIQYLEDNLDIESFDPKGFLHSITLPTLVEDV